MSTPAGTSPVMKKLSAYIAGAPVLGRKRAEALIAAVWSVEKIKDARALGALCRAA